MTTSIHPIVLMAIVSAIVVVVSLIAAYRAGVLGRPTLPGVVIAVIPSLVMLVLYYSLAVHMHQSLGGWPTSIGTRGFSPALSAHAEVATGYFWTLLLLSIFLWPPAFFLSVLIRSLRGLASYMGIHAASYAIAWALLLLAPSQFRYWWWD